MNKLMNNMNGEINKINNINNLQEISSTEEIDKIEHIICDQNREISILMNVINNYFDNPGLIAAHRQMKGQEGGAYVWTSEHHAQQRASHNWHDTESVNLAAKRDDAILKLKWRGVETFELKEKYIEVWVLTTEFTKRHAVIEKLKERRVEIFEQEKRLVEIVEQEKRLAEIIKQ